MLEAFKVKFQQPVKESIAERISTWSPDNEDFYEFYRREEHRISMYRHMEQEVNSFLFFRGKQIS